MDKEICMRKNPNNQIKNLPRNLWAVSITSFFMDISSEMVINILPLFLSSVLGVKTNIIGIIEGIAEATASILKVFSGWLSDKMRSRKWLAVLGYGLSAIVKPLFYFANSWSAVAGIRWGDRIGKGIRTAPRDALVADTVKPEQRGLAFGLHRAADTAGAMLGILIATLVVWRVQATGVGLQENTFRTLFSSASFLLFWLFWHSSSVPMRLQLKVYARHPKSALKVLAKIFSCSCLSLAFLIWVIHRMRFLYYAPRKEA